MMMTMLIIFSFVIIFFLITLLFWWWQTTMMMIIYFFDASVDCDDDDFVFDGNFSLNSSPLLLPSQTTFFSQCSRFTIHNSVLFRCIGINLYLYLLICISFDLYLYSVTDNFRFPGRSLVLPSRGLLPAPAWPFCGFIILIISL